MEEKLLLSTRSLQTSFYHQSKQLKVKSLRVLTLEDMAKQQLEEILYPKFIAQHKKQLQTYLFQLEISDQYKTWNIIKKYNEVLKLQEILKPKYKERIPGIPIRKQHQIDQKNSEMILKFMQIFITTLAQTTDILSEISFMRFIENLVPLDRKKMKTFKQMQLTKQAGGRHNQSYFQRALCYFTNWSLKFFTISSQGVYYTDQQKSFQIKEMIPFSVGFSLQFGQAFTGYTYGMIINSSHRILNMDACSLTNMVFFVYFLKKALKQSQQLKVKRFESFASVRSQCKGKYYIDGKDYFSDLYDYLLSAKKTVYITGWMLMPYFHLKRPDKKQETRLDNVLKKIAQNGVKVNIIVFLQPTVALSLNSQYTQNYLNSLHENIKVLRHPDYNLIPFLWSHHQKMVIIDQKVAFLGGLDIGYGRLDDKKHLLNDQNEQIWSGVDYCNYRVIDILDPMNHKICSIDRQKVPRMPWHDIGVKISGLSVLDLSRHFVQYWNYVNFQMSMNQRELLVYTGLHEAQIQNSRNSLTQLDRPQKIQKKKSTNSPKKRNQSKSPNKQSKSNIFELHSPRKKPQKQQFQREQDQKHHSLQFKIDIDLDHQQQMEFYAQHLAKQEAEQKKQKKLNKLWDKINPKQYFHKKNQIPNQQLIVTLNENKNQKNQKSKGKQIHQILRSASMWGLGLQQGNQQYSILNAYCSLIRDSKQFIYIQNQFFIAVQNPLVNCLKQRIKKAHQSNQKFRVIVIIPALPGFDGDPLDPYSTLVRVQIDYIYQTICRGQSSIFQQLSYIKNLDQYIQFFNLRTHGKINGIPVTEIIYVHSKLMIVDDKIALIGSANINDRSLLGSRDSQIAVVIQDTDQKIIQIVHQQPIIFENQQSSVNSSQKKKTKKQTEKRIVGKFAHKLRRELFQQHFGITKKQSEDYFNDDVWWSIIANAEKNSQIYRQIFGCYPDDYIKSSQDHKKLIQNADISKYDILHELIKGNAVKFQKHFFQNQDLSIGPSSKQYYVPSISFT